MKWRQSVTHFITHTNLWKECENSLPRELSERRKTCQQNDLSRANSKLSIKRGEASRGRSRFPVPRAVYANYATRESHPRGCAPSPAGGEKMLRAETIKLGQRFISARVMTGWFESQIRTGRETSQWFNSEKPTSSAAPSLIVYSFRTPFAFSFLPLSRGVTCRETHFPNTSD